MWCLGLGVWSWGAGFVVDKDAGLGFQVQGLRSRVKGSLPEIPMAKPEPNPELINPTGLHVSTCKVG